MNDYLKQFSEELQELDGRLTNLYDATREMVEDEIDVEVTLGWEDVDTSIEKLNTILTNAEAFITDKDKENPLADCLPFGFPVPVQGKRNMAMYEGMMGSWIDKLVGILVMPCKDKEKAKKKAESYVDHMLTIAKLLDKEMDKGFDEEMDKGFDEEKDKDKEA